MLAASTWISENIGWPVVAVATVAYEVTGEIRRKRRIARREAGQRAGERWPG